MNLQTQTSIASVALKAIIAIFIVLIVAFIIYYWLLAYDAVVDPFAVTSGIGRINLPFF